MNNTKQNERCRTGKKKKGHQTHQRSKIGIKEININVKEEL
jgi:hypothetical protein